MKKIALTSAALLAALPLAPVSAYARGFGGGFGGLGMGGGAMAGRGSASSGFRASSMGGRAMAGRGSAGSRRGRRYADTCALGYVYGPYGTTVPSYCGGLPLRLPLLTL